MATPSLLDLTPLRPPTAQDRAQLITAVNQRIAWQQQAALHMRQQILMRQPTTASGIKITKGGRSTQTATVVKTVPALVALQYQIWSLQMGQQAPQKLTSPAEVLQLFRRDGIDGRLLILGEPGSGKTQTLLTLASDLIRLARTSNEPVPVLMDLSGWQGETILEWATNFLWRHYRVPENCARPWLNGGQLVLLLDGFDNLETAQQRACAAAVENFLRSNLNQTAVLCCRRQVMERSGINFSQFNGGVHLLPLGAQQVKDYTTGLGQPEVWKRIKGSKVLQQLARLPFLLNCITELGQEEKIANYHDVVQQYLTHQLTPTAGKKKSFSARDSQRYLGWLAKYLNGRDRTFHIESLRPDALPDAQRWLYRLLVGLALGLLTGVFGHPMWGLAVGLLASQVDLEAFPKYKLSVASLTLSSGLSLLLRSLIPGVLLALVLGGFAGFVAARFGYGAIAFTVGGLLGLIVGLIAGFMFELRSGLQSSIQVRQRPNQDTFNAVRNLFLILILLGVLTLAGLNLLALSQGQALTEIVSPNLIRGAIATAIAFGLWASYGLQHFVIRALLFSSQSLPWNYARFLNFAAQERLLKKVGGGYQFIHEQMREQFLK